MKRGQAALEFLMTYGWAILSAMIVIGALGSYFYFNQTQFKTIIEECGNQTSDHPCFEMFDYISNLKEPYYDRGCDILNEYGVMDKSIECTLLHGIWENYSKKIDDCFDSPPVVETCHKVVLENEVGLSVSWLDKNCELEKDYGTNMRVDKYNDNWNKLYKCENYSVEVLLYER